MRVRFAVYLYLHDISLLGRESEKDDFVVRWEVFEGR